MIFRLLESKQYKLSQDDELMLVIWIKKITVKLNGESTIFTNKLFEKNKYSKSFEQIESFLWASKYIASSKHDRNIHQSSKLFNLFTQIKFRLQFDL